MNLTQDETASLSEFAAYLDGEFVIDTDGYGIFTRNGKHRKEIDLSGGFDEAKKEIKQYVRFLEACDTHGTSKVTKGLVKY